MSVANQLKPLLMGKIQARGFTSIRGFAKSANIHHSSLVRAMNGTFTPSREIINKWCDALNCTPQERQDIMHAAGYHLSPDELDEEESAA